MKSLLLYENKNFMYFQFIVKLNHSLTPIYSNDMIKYPDSKVHVANMGPTWALSAPDGCHVGPINLAIRVGMIQIWLYALKFC